MDKPIYIIVATDQNNGIGKDGQMPWHFRRELQHFAKITKPHTVIMGRTTWESLPEKFRPLPDRQNIVLTTREDYQAQGAEIAHSFEQAISLSKSEKIFIIGGAKVYAQALEQLPISGIYKTELQATYDCDTFFPEFTAISTEVLGQASENDTDFTFLLLDL